MEKSMKQLLDESQKDIPEGACRAISEEIPGGMSEVNLDENTKKNLEELPEWFIKEILGSQKFEGRFLERTSRRIVEL